jgi:hypothetical protein
MNEKESCSAEVKFRPSGAECPEIRINCVVVGRENPVIGRIWNKVLCLLAGRTKGIPTTKLSSSLPKRSLVNIMFFFKEGKSFALFHSLRSRNSFT